MYRILKQILLLGVSVAWTGPGFSDDFVSQEGELMSTERSVERADDPVHQTVLREESRTALVIVMEFSETGAQLKDTQLATVRSNTNPQDANDFANVNYVLVTAVNVAGEPVGKAFVPEQRIRIKENTGIVKSESQISTFAIPLSGSPVSLKVSGTMLEQDNVTISIAEIMKNLCKSYPRDPVCNESSSREMRMRAD